MVPKSNSLVKLFLMHNSSLRNTWTFVGNEFITYDIGLLKKNYRCTLLSFLHTKYTYMYDNFIAFYRNSNSVKIIFKINFNSWQCLFVFSQCPLHCILKVLSALFLGRCHLVLELVSALTCTRHYYIRL